MDLTRLRTGERVAAISAIALILIMFIFKWFGLKVSGAFGGSVEGTWNAWGSYGFTDIVLFITALAALGLAYLAASRQQLNLPVAASAITVALGALSLLLIIISIISPPDHGVSIAGVDATRKIGVWLGLIATAALTYGAYLAMQEEGGSVGSRPRPRAPRSGGTGTPPPSSGPGV